MQIQKFEAVISIEGIPRRVNFDGNALNIKDLNYQDVFAILESLELISNHGDEGAAEPKAANGKNGHSKASLTVVTPSFSPPPAIATPKPAVEAVSKPFIDEPALDAEKDAATLALSKLDKLRDVVSTLMERGITTPDALVAECSRLRDQLPVLQRVGGNFEDRVRRAAAACGAE